MGVLDVPLKSTQNFSFRPFYRGGVLDTSSAGSGSSAGISFITGTGRNGDGSAQMLGLRAVANAALGNYAKAAFWFNGPLFGIRYDISAADLSKFSVMIDRVAYEVRGSKLLNPGTMQPTSILFPDYFELISSTLSGGSHYCELQIPCNTTTLAQARIFGCVVDSAYNPSNFGNLSSIGSNQIAVLTTNTDMITSGSPGVSGNLLNARAIKVLNTTGSPITVTLRHLAYGVDIDAKVIGAGVADDFDLFGYVGDILSLQLRASAVGCVATLIGETY